MRLPEFISTNTPRLPLELLAWLSIFVCLWALILGPISLFAVIAFIEHRHLECNIVWVKQIRRFVDPNGSCCCRTCLADVDGLEQEKKRNMGARPVYGKLFKDLKKDEEGFEGPHRGEMSGVMSLDE
jgi:hypothetical protein